MIENTIHTDYSVNGANAIKGDLGMIELETKALGTIKVSKGQLFHFADGLLGFEEHQGFALLDEADESPFQWLQSTSDARLAFVVIKPELFLQETYQPEVSRLELEGLGVQKALDCNILLIVTIPAPNPDKMTANLQGPILLNSEKMIGRQVISTKDTHTVRVSIMDQLGD